MMSRWPRVTGSNDPGQRAVATQSPVRRRRDQSTVDEDDKRIAERPLPAGPEPFGRTRSRDPATGARRSTIASGASQPGRVERGRGAPSIVVVGRVVGRVGEHEVERRLRRRRRREERGRRRARRRGARSPRPSVLEVGARSRRAPRRSRSTSTARGGAARQRLDRERAGARVEVEHDASDDRAARVERREHRLAHDVLRRAHLRRRRGATSRRPRARSPRSRTPRPGGRAISS